LALQADNFDGAQAACANLPLLKPNSRLLAHLTLCTTLCISLAVFANENKSGKQPQLKTNSSSNAVNQDHATLNPNSSPRPTNTANPNKLDYALYSFALSPYTADYTLETNGFSLKARRQLRLNKGIYSIRLHAEASIASIDEVSTFAIEQAKVTTLTHTYKQKVMGSKEQHKIQFSNNAKQAKVNAENKHYEFCGEHKLYSELSYQSALRLELMKDPQLSLFNIYIAKDKKHLKHYRFKRVEERTLETAIGPVEAINFEYVKNAEKQKKFNVWLARELEYLIVKVAYSEKGKASYSLDISKLNTELN